MSRVSTLAILSILLQPGAAWADPAAVSHLTWIVDGRVQAAARRGNTLYIGGSFTRVSPAANVLGSLYALDAATGSVLTPRFALMNGQVRDVEPDGRGGFFAAGTFTTVGGVSQPYLAHLLADGTRDPLFAPVLNGEVVSIARSGSALYIVGQFSTIGGQPRSRVGAVDAVTGTPLPFAPLTPEGMTPLVVAADGGRVFVGVSAGPSGTSVLAFAAASGGAPQWQQALGGFATSFILNGSRLIVGGSFPTGGLKSLDPATGAVDTSWVPTTDFGFVSALGLSGSTLYVAGSFNRFGGQPRTSLAAIDINTAALLPWNPGALTPVTRLAVSPSGSVFVGGLFAQFGGQPRSRLAEIDAAGQVTNWIAGAYPEAISALEFAPSGALLVGSNITASGGEARSNLAAFDLETNTLLPWAPSASAIVNDLAIAGDVVYVGGAFSAISGVPRSFLGAVDAQTGAVLPWNPAPNGAATGLLVHGGWVYARGLFSAIGGAAIGGLARLEVTSGTADRSWRPGLGPSAMAVAGDVLYVGGTFQAIAGQARQNLAAFDLATGRLTPWNPGTIGSVSALAVNGGTLYVAGSFTQLAGQARAGLGALDLDGGALLAWNPGIGNGLISSLAVADAHVIAIWSGTGFGSLASFTGLAEIRADGQVTGWNPGFEQSLIAGGVSRVMAAGDSLIAVGMFGATSPAALQGVAAFALDGPAAPSGLRATPAGPGMRLEWNGLQPPPAGGYTIEAGSAAGLANLATLNVGSATAFSTPVPAGAFFVRVRTQGNEQSNEIVVRGGCSTPPPAPTALTAELAAGAVTLRWTAPIVMVDSYVIEAGSAAGLRNVASLTLPGAQTSVSAPAPPGTYFTRVRAANACGTSAASGETFFTVGSSASLPPAPTGLAATIAGLRLDLSWNAVAGATGYVIEAGSASGLADLAAITLGNATTFTAPAVPPGIYVVRVRAISPAGTGPPSSPDLLVRVP